MAKFEEVLELVRAGYSKNEVSALLGTPEAADNSIPATTDSDAAPAKEPEIISDPAPAVDPDAAGIKIPADGHYLELLKAIDNLTNTIISRNINSSNIEATPARTTDDMIASVLGFKTEPGGKSK